MNALLSAYDKTPLIPFARKLVERGWTLYASAGTARALGGEGINATDVATLLGGGPILGHRVVTLSREIYAGLLSRDIPEDIEELAKLKIPRIDLVAVDLYPLEAEIAREGSDQGSVIEQTDIGGPTLLRAAAKGGRIVASDGEDYDRIITWLDAGKPDEEETLSGWAAKAEALVAGYCLASARFNSAGKYDGKVGQRKAVCTYGENAWQQEAGLYDSGKEDPLAISKFSVLEGSPSYNTYADVDRMLQTVTHIAAGFEANFGSVPLIAVGVKHGNACGAAVGDDPVEVLKRMLEGDLRAIFGGLLMTNFPIDTALAEVLLTHAVPEGGKRLLDGIVAPSVAEEAISMLSRKQGKGKIITNKALSRLGLSTLDRAPRFRYVRGGWLSQGNYDFVLRLDDAEMAKSKQLPVETERDLVLAWAIGCTSNSNTIALVKDGRLLGNGVGQQDRVSACALAIRRAQEAGHAVEGAVAYSDSFFPFPDGPETLAKAEVKAVLTSSGSVRDEEVRAACEAGGLECYMIPDKRGRGFFGH